MENNAAVGTLCMVKKLKKQAYWNKIVSIGINIARGYSNP